MNSLIINKEKDIPRIITSHLFRINFYFNFVIICVNCSVFCCNTHSVNVYCINLVMIIDSCTFKSVISS